MHEPNLWETPEWAIQVFENLTGLRVVAHDLNGTLGAFLKPERFEHRSPRCAAVKARHDWACREFEIDRLRKEIGDFPEGRYHCCHAGYLEWVVPVFLKDRLAWVLFAGQARANGRYEKLIQDVRKTLVKGSREGEVTGYAETQAQAVMEALRQLRARLLAWHEQAAGLLNNSVQSGKIGNLVDRRLVIHSFLYREHKGTASLRELAGALNLGESRAGHLVKELFGCGYVELLTQIRLRTATALLRNSSLSILEVCLGSGFRDLSHFHRCFRKRFGTTPLRYRRGRES